MGDDVVHLAGDPRPVCREIEQRLLVAFAFSALAALGRGGQGLRRLRTAIPANSAAAAVPVRSKSVCSR